MNKILKNFLFFISGILFSFILILIFLIGFTFILTGSSVKIKNNSWLIFDCSQEIVEKPVSDFSLFSTRLSKLQFIDILKAIESATYDNRIEGIIINGDLINFSKAHVEEISKELQKFKESKKEIIAWFSEATNNDYELSLCANKIYMPDAESASLTLRGYYFVSPYLKEAVDKLGLEFTVVHIGSYKGTGENYVRNKMSDQMLSSINSVLSVLNRTTLEKIATIRNIPLANLKSLFAEGKTVLMTPKEALKYKFIDGIKNYEDIFNELSQYKNINRVSIVDYIKYLKRQKKVSNNKIAILYIDGTITNYYNDESGIYGDIVGAKSVINDINKIKNDNLVKAVIVRINSPGGSALASELILQELIKLRKEKPLYVSFGPIAASGGYYVGCAGEKIFSSSFSITGSIGVVSILLNHEKLNEKLGINFETVKENKFDDFLTTVRRPTPEEVEILKSAMKKIYDQFTEHVITERKIDKNKLSKIAEGRIWTGLQAKENGLIDEIGGLRDIIEYAISINNINNFTIESFPKPLTFFEKLFNTFDTRIELLDNYLDIKIKNIINFYKLNGKKPAFFYPLFGNCFAE